MSAVHWAGPYCSAQDAAGATLDWDPLTGRRAPRTGVRFVVRCRVTGFAHPRKRTFSDATAAEDWARRIEAARVLRSGCDDRGWPAEPSPAAGTRSAGGAAAAPTAPPTVLALGSDAASTSATATDPNPVASSGGSASAAVALAVPAVHGLTATAGTVALPPAGGLLGRDVADYVDELIELHRPAWEQQGDQGRGVRWWVGQLEFVKAVLRYEEGDERVGYCGIAAGDSLHFRLIGQRDFNRALRLRRTVNLRVAYQNRQRQEAYEGLLAEYEVKLAAWHARDGHKGRKPVPPAPPKVEVAVSDGQVIVSAHAEKALRTALSFVFDRAFDAGLFPPGPNPYRQWNPRGAGGRHAARRSPFRAVPKFTADARDYPGLGFWVDLGDAMAKRGAVIAEGLTAGERYRVLPLAWAQLAPRPGEGSRLRAEHVVPDGGPARFVPKPGGHLKARSADEIRKAPLSRLVAALLDEHVAAGLGGADGTLFVSPEGAPFDPTNFYEHYLRPAVADLCGDDKLWPQYPSLASASFYDVRKAGITTWVTYGADTAAAARWSGHTEYELLTSYRGVIDGVGRRATWKDMDTMVEQALLDAPPRGDGKLARHIRAWLGL